MFQQSPTNFRSLRPNNHHLSHKLTPSSHQRGSLGCTTYCGFHLKKITISNKGLIRVSTPHSASLRTECAREERERESYSEIHIYQNICASEITLCMCA